MPEFSKGKNSGIPARNARMPAKEEFWHLFLFMNARKGRILAFWHCQKGRILLPSRTDT
jgi:hypothetical protein